MDSLYRLGSKLLARIQHTRYRMRISDLVDRGLIVGKNVTIEYTAYIDDNYPFLIRIGDNCSIASHARVLAHDATVCKFTGGYTRIGKVELRENCFIGERAIILPGVTIGPNALVAAGSLVKGDIPPNSCAAGVPAKVYARFEDLVERHVRQIAESSVFELPVSTSHQAIGQEIWESVQDRDAYVRRRTTRYPYTLNIELG